MSTHKTNTAHLKRRSRHAGGRQRKALRITPPELGAGPNQVWTAALYNHRLYFAWLTFNPDTGAFFHRIMYYDRSAKRWITCYRRASRKGSTSEKQPTGRHQIARSSIVNGNLLFHFKTDQRSVILQSRDGHKFSKCPDNMSLPDVHPPDWEAALAQRPEDIKGVPRYVTTYGETMLAAVDDLRLGASVYRVKMGASGKTATWERFLERGASRYSQNGHLLAAVYWQDHLYVVMGCENKKTTSKAYSGFELLSTPSKKASSWDMLIGIPRVTPQGFKVPLSCRGAGMNEFKPHDFLFLQPTKDYLVLGTYSELTGFACWFSKDGITWEQHIDLDLAGTHPIVSAQPFAVSNSLFLLANGMDPVQGPTADLWMLSD